MHGELVLGEPHYIVATEAMQSHKHSVKLNLHPCIFSSQTLFEQVLATCDPEIFTQLMVKWNIMIQEQVLVLLIASRGSLPDSMIPMEVRRGRVQQKSNMVGAEDQREEELLQQVMK